MNNLPKLIVLDDEDDLAEFVCDVAEQAGFNAIKFNDPVLFKQQYDNSADIIILDLLMPKVDGVEIIRFLTEIHSKALLILMSGFDSSVLLSAQKLAIEQGLNFAGSLNKPFRVDDLEKLLTELTIKSKNNNHIPDFKPPTIDQLRQALAKNEFIVYYQPKVGISKKTAASVEALTRWQHPEYGLVQPDMFIPLIEEFDLINEFTWLVLHQAMTQCKLWLNQGLTVNIAINMSANTLKDLDLPEKMASMINSHGLHPSQIILEITETVLMQELIKSLDILTRLRMKGIDLSIDDFGTGYSSLAQLHRVPFSEIKIDRSFVSEMEHDPEAAAIVETIIMLGHKLKMKTVAEGVEAESCQKKLKLLKCDQAQGYYFAKPMKGQDIFSWFEQYQTSSVK